MSLNDENDLTEGQALCHACGLPSARPYRHIKDMNLYRCSNCGLVFEHPLPSAEELKKMYDETYYAAWGNASAEELVKKQKIIYFEKHLENIEKLKPEGALLDIGCAKGYFVELALHRGYSAYGLEISEFSGKIASEAIGSKRIEVGAIEDAPYEPDMFDVVTMFDYLEHVPDLDVVLRVVSRILKPGGILYIVTPNISSLSSRIMGSHWWHYKKEHLFYFNRKSLTKTVERFGFKMLDCEICKKTLSIEYIISQMKVFYIPVISPLILYAGKILPRRLRTSFVTFPSSGEFQMVARKL